MNVVSGGNVAIRHSTVSSESKSILEMNFDKVDRTSINSVSWIVFRQATTDQNNCGKSISCSLYSSAVMALSVIKICIEKLWIPLFSSETVFARHKSMSLNIPRSKKEIKQRKIWNERAAMCITLQDVAHASEVRLQSCWSPG
ncbi:hypothetical protein OGAPHI_002135 [Ogataea philodendri]|uniref:Uncharacterized protein n=1 Tax=Ogataea philodendri TaxID=1378263 RepID=A0A9P8PAW5_9ASCO|nr:uncharacterized protein OGAPHI_002135 [Ogataea philodendri]KAH3668381.1 hypothetical protein OGAPHI_002135 [Ogataea philodendri]